MNLRSLFFPLLLASAACGAAATTPPAARPALMPVAPAGPLLGAAREDDAAVPITSHDPTWGSRTAPVTLVEFSDFQCPFSKRAQATLAALREAYGPEKLRMVWKDNPLPFHPYARPAAEAAAGVFELAGPAAFWKFHDEIFDNQSTLSDGNYERWAEHDGVTDGAAFHAGLTSHRWARAIDADLDTAGALGARGTPTFFINGVAVVGAQPVEAFRRIIDVELAEAQARLAAGTPPDRVYAELARDNRAKAPKGEDDDEETEDTKTVFKIPLGTAPVRGSAAALVTIVEFSDFQCPFCGRVEPTLDALRHKYGDQVRLVWRNEPLPNHLHAEPAAEAALEVRAEKGDPAFWTMHDKLFAAQKDLSDDVVVKLAREVGASPERVKHAMAAHTHARELEADGDVAEDFRAEGTPHFFIDGRRLVGAQPQERFEQIIDEELKRAQGLLAKGVPQAGLYDALVRDGKTPPEPERKTLPASLPPGSPAQGSPAALVTVHEWADFECPFCGRVQERLAAVTKQYGARVRFVWHDLPLSMHPDAPLAAQAGREALAQGGPEVFWALHDLMLSDQEHLQRDTLNLYARSLHMDMGRWNAALDSTTHKAEIDQEAFAAAALGISGTPAFIIVPARAQSGYFINGAQPFGTFRRLIERALAEAK